MCTDLRSESESHVRDDRPPQSAVDVPPLPPLPSVARLLPLRSRAPPPPARGRDSAGRGSQGDASADPLPPVPVPGGGRRPRSPPGSPRRLLGHVAGRGGEDGRRGDSVDEMLGPGHSPIVARGGPKGEPDSGSPATGEAYLSVHRSRLRVTFRPDASAGMPSGPAASKGHAERGEGRGGRPKRRFFLSQLFLSST